MNQKERNDFKHLFEYHKKSVFAMALSVLKDYSLAEDVSQEVFIKYFIYKQKNTVTNVQAWLMRVTRNTALDVYRKKKQEVIGFGGDAFDSEPAPFEDPIDRMVLHSYLSLLDETERQIVVLKDIAGLKHREIASIVELPLGTVLWKYNSSIKKMRKGVKGGETHGKRKNAEASGSGV